MRRIYPLLLYLSLSLTVFNQNATFYKLDAGLAPVIDGYIDALWNDIDEHDIDRPLVINSGVPTLDVATWQAAWNDTALFVLIIVEENDHCDIWCSGAVDWESDKPEIFLDVNVGDLDDGDGPLNWPNGHYQIAPAWQENIDVFSTCETSWMGGWPYCYGYTITGEDYIYEYSVPFTSLTDRYDQPLNPFTNPVIGFEVNIIDRDEGDSDRQIVAWTNDASGPSADISWNNMDDCGEVNFLDGEGPPVDADAAFERLEEGEAPVIDGLVDELWNDIDAYTIDKPHAWNSGVPTLDVAKWQAVWNDTAMFLMITVEENDHCDTWCSGDVEWVSDRAEIYLDLNIGSLEDGFGPQDWPNGHYQIAPAWQENVDNYYTCENSWMGGWPYCFGYSITGENYTYEYSIPFSSITDEYGVALDPDTDPVFGFDVYIADRDDGDDNAQIVAWINDGTGPSKNHNWSNMDDCGKVFFMKEEAFCNYDYTGTELSVYSINFYYVEDSIYDVEIDLYDIGTCDTLSIYQDSVTIVEDTVINFETPDFGYLIVDSVWDHGNNITGYYDIGNTGCAGSDSREWSVTRVSPVPDAPVPVFPPDNIFVFSEDLKLQWSQVAGLNKYAVQLSEYPDFSSIFLSASGITSSSYNVSGLQSSTTYYWRVKSENLCDESTWSVSGYFHTGLLSADPDVTHNNSGYLVYPSPADNYINFECPGSSNSVVSIYSFDGKLLIREYIHNDIAIIDIHHLPTGIYLLKVVNENMNKTGKIIIK